MGKKSRKKSKSMKDHMAYVRSFMARRRVKRAVLSEIQ